MNWLQRLKNQNGPDTDATKATKAPNVAFVASIPGPLKENDVVAGANVAFVASVPGHIENSMMAAMVVVPVPDWAADPANDAAVGLTVASVAPVAVATIPGSNAAPAGTIDTVPTTAPDPDRWCWPHSDAVTGAEIDRFTGRMTLFTAKGLTPNEAEVLADKLLIRDRDGDDRRVCLECSFLSGWNGRRQCRGLQYAAMGGPLASAGQVAMLQRCNGFKGSDAGQASMGRKP